MDFLCVDLLLSAEHAFLYNDLDTFKRLALNVDDISFQNYSLRDANLLMTGRRFDREKGEIILHRDGPLVWRWDILTNLYLAAHTVFLNAQNLTNPQNIPNNLPNDFSVGEIRPIYETSNSAQDN